MLTATSVIAKGYADNVSDPSNRVEVENFLLSISEGKPISTYPNPVTNELFIENLQKSTPFQISDLSGRIFAKGMTTSTQTGQKIDLSDHAPGLYLLIIRTEERTTRIKIYKE
jgi:hypothetical protein